MPFRVVIALDSLKGSVAAAAASRAVAEGWRTVRDRDGLVRRPMADGGEGTRDAFAVAVPGARRMPVIVAGPDGRDHGADWLLLPDGTGVVELAATSGIELLGGALRPWDADTRGFGQAIAAALDHGVRRLVLGIGSSASTDGGTGMLSALGARFRTAGGDPVAPGARGLADLASVDLSGLRLPPPEGVDVLTDVANPLLGPRGAAAVFGPQKGFAPGDVPSVDAALVRLAALLSAGLCDRAGRSCGADDGAGIDPAEAGSGAAGGTGFALRAWGARLVPGAAEVARLIGLAEAIATADLVVTGEGAYDGQSAAGKAPAHVADLAARAGVPVALVAGRIAPDADTSPFAACLSLSDLAGGSAAALADPLRWLRRAGAELAARRAAGSARP